MADDSGRINQLLSETTFLYGGNSAFVEDLYAKYAGDPASVPADWRAYFDAFGEQPASIVNAEVGPSWAKAATPTARPDWLSAIDGLWPAVEAKVSKGVAAKAEPVAHSSERAFAGRAGRHARFRSRDHDDPRLPHPRAPPRQPRSPRLREGARRLRRARPGHLRLRRERLGSADLPRLRARARDLDHPRDHGDPAPHLLRHGGRAVHAHLQPGREGVDPGAHRGQG